MPSRTTAILAPAALVLGLSLSMTLPAVAGSSDHVRDMTTHDWSNGPRFPREERVTPDRQRSRVASATISEDDDAEVSRPQRRSYDTGEGERRPRVSKRRDRKTAKGHKRKPGMARRAGDRRTATARARPKPSAAAPRWTKRSLSTAGPRGSGQQGVASFYWQPQRVAAGGWFNPNAMTAAHKTLPFGTKVRVTHKSNGRSVVVTINDRGPYIAGRIIDLSKAAAGVIGMTAQGIAGVIVEVLGR